MRYYVMSDIHSFYNEMLEALRNAGYFQDTGEKKIIILGDLFDRGPEAQKLENFILELIKEDAVILIKGNHEDLMEDLITNWHRKSYGSSHHATNGTLDTLVQLSEIESIGDLFDYPEDAYHKIVKMRYLNEIIPEMHNYYETDHYVFVHGWIPCIIREDETGKVIYENVEDWRNATPYQWQRSRWVNGMVAHHYNITEPGKTIVCGHYRCNYGHYMYEESSSDNPSQNNYTPYYNTGIIAIDGCTVLSGIVNCLVIDD